MAAELARITVVGLGPAGSDLLTRQTADVLTSGAPVWLRTKRHPAAEGLDIAGSFDEVYESAHVFDDVYETIVERLVVLAEADRHLVYAVPGSPSVAERTVELLLEDNRIATSVLPAMSFLELCWTALAIDPMAEAVAVVDALKLIDDAAARRGPLLITQVHSAAVLDDVILTLDDAAPEGVVVLQGLGTPDERVVYTEWSELRDAVTPDHLTTLWISSLAEPIGAAFARFETLVETLRRECPWDAEQTHASLRPFLVEETYEVLEAIDAVESSGDGYVELEEELGDLLFQVFIHSRLATEAGRFTMSDVARGIHDKLVTRHPHVFGDADARSTIDSWERAKQQAKGRESALDGIPAALPALMGAFKTQRRAASAGFGGPDLAWALADVDGELAELRADPSEEELGDLLFASVQVARMLDVDPEQALRGATGRFAWRFRHVESTARQDGTVLGEQTLEQLQQLWQHAKLAEKAMIDGRARTDT